MGIDRKCDAGISGRLISTIGPDRLRSVGIGRNALSSTDAGGMAEWFKAHAWKACWGASPSGVRIPVPPPTPSNQVICGSWVSFARCCFL